MKNFNYIVSALALTAATLAFAAESPSAEPSGTTTDSEAAAETTESSPSIKPGDTNGDGFVDVADLLAVMEQYGQYRGKAKRSADISPDEGNNNVDVDDLLEVIMHWGA